MQTCRSCQSANLDAATACSVCGESLENFTIAEAPVTPLPYGGQQPPPPTSGYASPPPAGPPPAGPPPGYSPPQQPGPPPQYGPPQQPGPPPQYGPPAATVYAPPGTPGGYVQTAPTNTMAVTSLMLSLVGVVGAFMCLLPIVLAPAGAIVGHVSLNRIKTSGQQGRGLAIAGIIIGWLGTLFAVGMVVLIILVAALDSGSGY